MKKFFHNLIFNQKFNLPVIAAVVFLIFLPILVKGLTYGYDFSHHFQCAYSYYEGFLNGDLYPSWSAVRNLGYGGMELRLYPPISHYTLAVFYWFSQDWFTATWLTILLYGILGSFSVYWWARELMSPPRALFAGIIYTLLPYHLNQIYNTFFFAEFVGTAILPFSFLFVYRVAKRGRAADIIGLGISFAALVLSHLPLTVIGSFCFAVYGLSLLEKDRFFSQIAKLTGGVLTGLALSSFFWIKVLQEQNWMAKTEIYQDLWINFRLHFLFTPFQTYTDTTAVNVYENGTLLYDQMLLCAAGLVIFCAVPFIIYARGKGEGKFKGLWVILLFSIFLTMPASTFLWEKVKLLQEVQFSWRWLSIISTLSPILAADKIHLVVKCLRGKYRPLGLLIAGCVFTIVVYTTTQTVGKALFIPKDITEITVKSVENIKGFPFWWPIWARLPILSISENTGKLRAENRETEIKNWEATDREFQISAGEAENVRVATFYHPNWQATVNNLPVEISPDANGAILISLPPESVDVKLIFRETTLLQIGRWLSALSWLGLVCFLIFKKLKRFLPQSFVSHN